MSRALELARRGEGAVEPNPMVGCVLVRDGLVIGEGWHERFGGPHAEVNALARCDDASGATAYVSLEPCCHTGKTPPCAEALIASQVARVVVAQRDPFPQVDGGGLRLLTAAGITVDTGLLESEARYLNAPYLMKIQQQRAWVIAKWAMTCDGKIASATGHSQWISGERSRAQVHQLRGRVDAIVVGRGTVETDNPMLTARPEGQRVAMRVVFDSRASLSKSSKLVATAKDYPTLVVCGDEANGTQLNSLRDLGVEILQLAGGPEEKVVQSLREFANRGFTNVLVEGGNELLGSFLDADAIDELHVYMAPKIIGGSGARHPLGGVGLE
ncbi:MAG: diaminohydroxyphosphoribosylaminopyrimidine deaminase, partial [Pirellulaceae bacterium]